jgi:hypothetical protein
MSLRKIVGLLKPQDELTTAPSSGSVQPDDARQVAEPGGLVSNQRSFAMTIRHIPARVLLVLPFLFGLQNSHAQSAAPTVSSTLDVCHDTATGKWRYSGVVSVLGKGDPAALAVDYRVQNAVSRAGYADVLKLSKVPDTESGIVDPVTGAKVFRFSGDAEPYSLGTLRNTTSVAAGAGVAAFAAGDAYTAQVCGCPVIGCVRTQGYWKSKPGVVWPAPYARDAQFFLSGLTWQELFNTPPRGNAYIILAHQYMAARLNTAVPTSAPAGVQAVYYAAEAWFGTATLNTCPNGGCALQKTWASTLDTYNNGLYPGAPQHCD